jgi:RNA polymerase-interacting CarD/CdnL/TRCF family regulator
VHGSTEWGVTDPAEAELDRAVRATWTDAEERGFAFGRASVIRQLHQFAVTAREQAASEKRLLKRGDKLLLADLLDDIIEAVEGKHDA